MELIRCTAADAGEVEAFLREVDLTVTGLDGEWMRVSSWGRELYISRAAYEAYMHARSIPLFTNLLYLKRV